MLKNSKSYGGLFGGMAIGLGVVFGAAAVFFQDRDLSKQIYCRIGADGKATLMDSGTHQPVLTGNRITIDRFRNDCSIKEGGAIFSYKIR